jgi:hypothetical protein
MPHEERAQRLDVLRRLDRLAHGLHEMGERVELPADEPDDEVVVVDVEAVAGEADVVGEVGIAIAPPQHAVFPDDRALLLGTQPREGAGPAQRVPDRPWPGRVQRRPAGPMQQPVLQVGLEPGGVGPAEHREGRLVGEREKGFRVEELAEPVREEGWGLAHGEHAHPARVVDVLVQRALEPSRLEGPHQRLRVDAAPEDLELHEQAAVGGLLVGAALAHVDWDVLAGTRGRALGPGTHGWRLSGTPAPNNRAS